MVDLISGFLADTWWYGLTSRITVSEFESLAQLRVQQGFSAVQIVVGIPPEVGPENPNASSHQGYPWTLDGKINHDYLMYARDRVEFLNTIGLTAIIYGAWGHQIDWIGPRKMSEWWTSVVDTLDELNVIYCLSGEINLWIGQSSKLLPAKSTGDLVSNTQRSVASRILTRQVKDYLTKVYRFLYRGKLQKRREDWDYVLGVLSDQTQRPILVHPTVNETGFESVLRPYLLSANTVQTGHDYTSRQRLWQLPTSILSKNRETKYINLEPWYEGIRESFGVEDQIFAYWTSMLSGAASYCYGAQGIWNVGDGHFLSHWGKQTYSEAKNLDTPRFIGLSHQQLMHWRSKYVQIDSIIEAKKNDLISIGNRKGERFIQYFPDISKAHSVPYGKIWLPLEGRFSESVPSRGQVVILTD